MQQDYILRSQCKSQGSIDFCLRSDGSLKFSKERAAKIKILRRETSGLITVLWGDRIVSGVLSCSGEQHSVIHLTLEVLTYKLILREAALDALEQGLVSAKPENGGIEIISPIPGLVKVVKVNVDDSVTAGQTLIVLEAMKMENEITAPHDGDMDSIEVKAGQAVAAGAILARINIHSVPSSLEGEGRRERSPSAQLGAVSLSNGERGVSGRTAGD